MSRGGHHLGTLSTANSASSSGRLRLQHQFLPSHGHATSTQHYQQQQLPQHTLRFDGKKSQKYATNGTIANAPRFNQNSYEVSPSSFRYYSSSVEYLADHNGQLSKSSPDSGYPGENGDLSNGFYENLPFHGMKQQPLQPHKQPLTYVKKAKAPAEAPEDDDVENDDELVYADSDYRDLYAYGPVFYTQASRHAAQTKKEEMANRYGTIGRK